ncbi:MAG: aminodeoxychorismate/anthranilate synthase component II [Ignavibacteriales bacterium]|nr:aminodeoxychorismate/anthranilate synthase component II [Ignavibacteriales bacterium]
MKILVIDNYDSFTFNLVQLINSSRHKIIIKRNDELNEQSIKLVSPDKILISPGPGKPENSKASIIAIKYFGSRIPILGVCLGHQAIAIAFGAKVVKASELLHGKTSKIYHDGNKIFNNMPQPFTAMRYHSLIVDKNTLPDDLIVTAETSDGLVMGIRHNNFPIEGIQFHPESILTENGKKLVKNWLLS